MASPLGIIMRGICVPIGPLEPGPSQVSWSLYSQSIPKLLNDLTVSQGQLYEPDLKAKADQENYFQVSTCCHSLTYWRVKEPSE